MHFDFVYCSLKWWHSYTGGIGEQKHIEAFKSVVSLFLAKCIFCMCKAARYVSIKHWQKYYQMSQ